MKKYAKIFNLNEEKSAELFENARLNGSEFFLKKPFMVLPGTRNYKVEFKSQKDLNIFNNIMKIVCIEKPEKWVDILYTSEENATKMFDNARRNGVKFQVLSVEYVDYDDLRNYRIKFISQKDLNKFRKISAVR